MTSLNRFCQLASLLCCMVLGAEGYLFVHNIETQVRAIEQPLVAKVDKPHSNMASEVTKVAIN